MIYFAKFKRIQEEYEELPFIEAEIEIEIRVRDGEDVMEKSKEALSATVYLERRWRLVSIKSE